MYIGKRTCYTDIEKDSYLGSGLALKKAIEQYGRSSFTKYIIEEFETAEEAFLFEEQVIKDVNAVEDERYYNLVKGGANGCEGRFGELHSMFGKTHTEDTINKMRIAKLGNKNSFYGKLHTEESKRKMSYAAFQNIGEKNPFYGRKHSEESKRKMSEKGKQRVGEKNGFYGKKHTKETREKISKANKGKLAGVPKTEEQKKKMSISNKNRKEIVVDGKKYFSVTEAEKETGIGRHKLSKMAKDTNNDKVRFV